MERWEERSGSPVLSTVNMGHHTQRWSGRRGQTIRSPPLLFFPVTPIVDVLTSILGICAPTRVMVHFPISPNHTHPVSKRLSVFLRKILKWCIVKEKKKKHNLQMKDRTKRKN